MMKLVRLPNLRPLLLKCEILRRFESLNILKDLYVLYGYINFYTNEMSL